MTNEMMMGLPSQKNKFPKMGSPVFCSGQSRRPRPGLWPGPDPGPGPGPARVLARPRSWLGPGRGPGPGLGPGPGPDLGPARAQRAYHSHIRQVGKHPMTREGKINIAAAFKGRELGGEYIRMCSQFSFFYIFAKRTIFLVRILRIHPVQSVVNNITQLSGRGFPCIC